MTIDLNRRYEISWTYQLSITFSLTIRLFGAWRTDNSNDFQRPEALKMDAFFSFGIDGGIIGVIFDPIDR